MLPKKVLSHDRFLVKLQMQRYASDAVGPLSFLLGEFQAGKSVQPEKAIQAIQTSLCWPLHICQLKDRWKSVLQHLNKQLVPMAEEDCPNEASSLGQCLARRQRIGWIP